MPGYYNGAQFCVYKIDDFYRRINRKWFVVTTKMDFDKEFADGNYSTKNDSCLLEVFTSILVEKVRQFIWQIQQTQYFTVRVKKKGQLTLSIHPYLDLPLSKELFFYQPNTLCRVVRSSPVKVHFFFVCWGEPFFVEKPKGQWSQMRW